MGVNRGCASSGRERETKACVNLVCEAFAGTEDAKPRAYVLKYVVGLVVDGDCEETALVARRRARESETGGEGEGRWGMMRARTRRWWDSSR